MTTIELGLSPRYVQHWGLLEAVRELIQNAQDAAVDGNPMTVRHTGDKLIIVNEGVVLPRKVLLLGNTAKEFRQDLAGKHGEGLKLAMLVAAREGIELTIRNGPEVWTPKIVTSKQLAGERVLAVEVDTGRKPEPRFRVELAGVDAGTWEEMKWRFLSVTPRPDNEVVRTSRGSVLLGPKDKGRLFVKGIYVCNNPLLAFGYDFKEADLDRDRRVVDDYDTAANAREILNEVLSQGRIDTETVYRMMLENRLDVQVATWSLPKKLQEVAVDKFRAAHGDKAVPVASMAEAADLEHLGATPVIVPLSLQRLLEPTVGTIEQVRQRLSAEVVEVIQPEDMNPVERTNLMLAIERLKAADPDMVLPAIQVVVFRDIQLRGMYHEGKALIAHRLLEQGVATVLRTLIHEVAHRRGKDGDKGHVAEIERLWELCFQSVTSVAG